MSKITLIGTGMIGQTLAHLIILKELAADLVLLDIDIQKAVGAMMDIGQACPMEQKDINYRCTSDYADIKGSDIIIITAGISVPAHGQDLKNWNRDMLLEGNVKIVAQIARQVKHYSPDSFIIIITNPLDSIVKVFQNISGFEPHRVIGEAGTDDTRFRHFCAAELGVSVRDVTGFVAGEHGDSMVPLFSTVTLGGLPVTFSDKQKAAIAENVIFGGKKVIDICGISPYRTVSAAAINTVEAYIRNRNRVLAVSNYDAGSGLYYAWPCIINHKGVARRISSPADLPKAENAAVKNSMEKIKTNYVKMQAILDTLAG